MLMKIWLAFGVIKFRPAYRKCMYWASSRDQLLSSVRLLLYSPSITGWAQSEEYKQEVFVCHFSINTPNGIKQLKKDSLRSIAGHKLSKVLGCQPTMVHVRACLQVWEVSRLLQTAGELYLWSGCWSWGLEPRNFSDNNSGLQVRWVEF